LFVAPPAYVWLALVRAYRLSPRAALAATIALSATFLLLIVAYRGMLFFTTYYTL
jgi:hypothetical protein